MSGFSPARPELGRNARVAPILPRRAAAASAQPAIFHSDGPRRATLSATFILRREGTAMKQRARILLPAAVLSVGAGCASKDWVEQELNRRDARLEQTLSSQVQQSTDSTQQRLNAVDQRVQTVEGQNAELQGRSVALEARSSQLEARSATLEDRSAQLEARVQDSSSRAADAGARAEGVDARLTQLWAT